MGTWFDWHACREFGQPLLFSTRLSSSHIMARRVRFIRTELVIRSTQSRGCMSDKSHKWPPHAVLFSAVVMLILQSGCAHSTGAAAPPPPLDVSVVAVRQADVPVYTEWIGTLDGYVNADIKAEISGYLTQQAY